MVLASTIIAVALGLTPATEARVSEVEAAAVTRQVGRYTEVTDSDGARHLRGFDQHGRPFNVTVGSNGRVQAVVGGAITEFTIADAN